MNFHRFSKAPQNYLLRLLWSGWNDKTRLRNKTSASFTGVYIINQDVDDSNFKIGVSFSEKTGVYNRISKKYKLCYPFENEFWIHFIILAPPNQPSKDLERIIINAFTADNSSYSTEWRVEQTKASLMSKLNRVLNKNKKKWSYLISFGKRGWKVYENDGRSKLLINRDMKIRDNYTKKPLEQIAIHERSEQDRDYDEEVNIPNSDKDKTKFNPTLPR